jgi:hypothetical protein
MSEPHTIPADVPFKQTVLSTMRRLIPSEWYSLLHHDNGSARVTVWVRGGGLVTTLRVGHKQLISVYAKREHAARIVEILKSADFPCHKSVAKALVHWKEGRTLVTRDWDK